MTQVCQRYVWGMDRNEYPVGWLDEDDGKENPDEAAQLDKWKQCVGGFISSLYARNKELGIIYENIVAQIIGFESRTGLYSELNIEPPDTGRPDNDDYNDVIPEPIANFNPFEGVILNSDPAQENGIRIQIGDQDNDNDNDNENEIVEDID